MELLVTRAAAFEQVVVIQNLPPILICGRLNRRAVSCGTEARKEAPKDNRGTDHGESNLSNLTHGPGNDAAQGTHYR